MDTLQLKKKLIQTCIDLQKKIAENALAEMKDAYDSTSDYGNPEDWFDTFKADMLNKSDLYSQQLLKAQEEIKNLERINTNKLFKTADFGAIVVTETQKLFISIGIGKVLVDTEVFYAISPSVPLFLSLKGKKAGETYDFRGNKGTILEVY